MPTHLKADTRLLTGSDGADAVRIVDDEAPSADRVILGEGGSDEGRDHRALGLAGVGERVPHDVDAAALPVAGEHPGHGGSVDAFVGVADHHLHAPQAAPGQLAQKLDPEGGTLGKGHGRIEKRIYTASGNVDWIGSARAYPGQPRFKGIRTIVKVEDQTELADKCTFDTRYYIASTPLDIPRLARAIRAHWAVESLHWSLDITFNEDQSRYRARHGAQNMATVRRFAFNLIKHTHLKAGGAKSKSTAAASLKSKRKVAGWSPDFLLQVLSVKPR